MLVLLTSLLKRFLHLFKACLQIRWLDTETGFTPILQSKLFLVPFVVKFKQLSFSIPQILNFFPFSFFRLKKFFFDAGNMAYVKALVPVPVLPQVYWQLCYQEIHVLIIFVACMHLYVYMQGSPEALANHWQKSPSRLSQKKIPNTFV